MAARMVARIDALMAVAQTKIIENKDADCRREVAVVAFAVDLTDQVRHRHLLGADDLSQSLPKFVLKRDARLVPIENDRSLDDDRFQVSHSVAQCIGPRSRTTKKHS